MKTPFTLVRLSTLLLTVVLAACALNSAKYQMDDQTRQHPATKRFITFAKKAKHEESYDNLVKSFYIEPTQQYIKKSMGWRKFVYSSTFRVVKDGRCDTLTLTALTTNRVQLDCTGSMLIRSMIIADRTEDVHLRVFMIERNGIWYLDKSGYVHTNKGVTPPAYSRAGIKFKSVFEQ